MSHDVNLNGLYRGSQIEPLNASGEFQKKIKLRNPNNNSETFWLNVTDEEFNKITNILNGE